MKRLHVHVAVKDLADSARFYSTLFDAEPSVLKPDYAKWVLEDPKVNFAISTHRGEAGVDHLGIQVESADELRAVASRLRTAGPPVVQQNGANCCYARGDKEWAKDSQGVIWETFLTTSASTTFGANGMPAEMNLHRTAAACAPAISVFDPPLCCSTGVCGPSVDPALARFAADLDWLRQQGVNVERHNLAQEPGAFVANPVVKKALEQGGNGCLPLVLAGGTIVSSGAYPDRDALARAAGVEPNPHKTLYSEAVAELVAIGAAIAANCEPCLKFHFDRARRLGVSREDMGRAVATAQAVKETPARAILSLAERLLSVGKVSQTGAVGAESACCGSEEKMSAASEVASRATAVPCCGESSAKSKIDAPATSSRCCGAGGSTATAETVKPTGKCC